MCDICKSEGLDSKFINGTKFKLYNRKIYSAFRNRAVNIKLCFLHDIEFFTFGESKFIQFYPAFVNVTLKSRAKESREYDSFGEGLSNISQLI